MRCHCPPKVIACRPGVHCTLSWIVKLFRYSVNDRASVPRHWVGAFGPANDTSGNDESASPDGSPRRPALIGYWPSMVALKIGTPRCANPAPIWFTSDDPRTDVCLT